MSDVYKTCQTCMRKVSEFNVLPCGGCKQLVCKRCRLAKPVQPNSLGEYLLAMCPKCY